MRRAKNTLPGTSGVLRVEARSARLAPKLRRGDIAVLDQVDLDEPTAQTLLRRGVVAVVNAATSSSGRYPNRGPSVLVEAGVPLLDAVGHSAFAALRDGRPARVDGDALWVDDEQVAHGTLLDAEAVAHATEVARGGVGAQLADVLGSTAAALVDERDLLLTGTGLPAISTRFADRHVLVVGPAYGAADDVRRTRRYRRRYKPLLVGADGGGDALLAAGLRPDVLIGDPSVMSDEVLKKARVVVLRADAEGRDRVHDLAVPASVIDTHLASEDLAVLLAAHGRAAAIVTAGVPRTVEELLDRGRAASSTLVTRFAHSTRVLGVDLAVALTPRRSWGWPVLSLLLAAGLAVTATFGPHEIVHWWRQLGT